MSRTARTTGRCYAVAPILGGIELLSASYPTHVFPPHAHDTLVLAVVEHGEIEVTCEGRTLRVAPGSVLAIAPGAIHSARSPSGNPWEYRALYLSPSQCAALAPRGDAGAIAGGTVLRDRDAYRALLDVHSTLRETSAAHASAGLASTAGSIAGLAHESLLALRGAAAATAVPERIGRVRGYIDQHLQRRISLEELAAVADMSRFALVRAFGDAMGVSPYAYCMQRRLDHARRLLGSGEPIARTAARLGFGDQSHLTRWFLRVVGVTPGEYARGLAAS